ncbi:MAG: hypothetical protein IPJ19_00435 [Planctomycetes bacterium]|nr:hypothetical protein [Planctomycetota bacterium]
MSLGKHLGTCFVLLAALVFAGCSAGSSSSMNSIQTAVQDLAQDPDGLVTVITLHGTGGLGSATTANFSASGGQLATDVQVVDSVATVTWDARVSPADTVAVTGLSGISTAQHAVTSSDASAPTFTITSADMNTGLGADVIVVQFAGTNIVPATAEDTANWTLSAGSFTFDLTGSTLSFDAGTQSLTMNLGTGANVWPDFTLAATGVTAVSETAVDATGVDGTGSGDATAPTLVSAEQNLTEDIAGRVIDFTFDESMSPLVFTQLGRYAGTGPDLAISAEALSETVVRVTFNNPIVPGLDTIDLNGLYDAHGLEFPDTTQAITQPSPMSNALTQPAEAVTVPNGGNDYITFITDVPFDPDSAEDFNNWTLHVAGNLIDLSTQTFEYDLATQTTTITLDFNLQNGQSFTIAATNVVDVDGVYSGLGDFQTVAGDATAPSVSSIVQNRSVDTTGSTVDVSFDEDVDQSEAENLANWASAGTQNLLSATLQQSATVVRLVFDAPLVPTIDGIVCSSMSDLAGNTMSFSQNVGASTDTTAPSATSFSANALAGAGNDTLVVNFDDAMYEPELVDTSTWTVESPIGSGLNLTPSSVVYDSNTHKATLTLEASDANLQNGDDFSVAFSGVHDIAYNAISSSANSGSVTAETTSPTVADAYIDSVVADEVVVTFSEPCAQLDNLYDVSTNPTGTRFLLRDSLGGLRGSATAASVLTNGLSVRLSFGLTVDPSDTLDLIGVSDLAGNPLYPVLAHALSNEDSSAPTLLSAVGTTVSGESNDTLVLTFDRSMSAFGVTDVTHYTLAMTNTGAVGLGRATASFDGDATVTITLAGTGTSNLDTSDTFSISATGLYSAQGVAISGSTALLTQALAGDLVAPSVGVSSVRVDPSTDDSLLIEFNEALNTTDAVVLANYDLNGGNLASSAALVGPRVVRATFGVTPAPGDTLDVSGTDLAHNASGVYTRSVQSADSTGPLVSSVAGIATSGYGGDVVSITFSEPVKSNSALNPANYVITSNGTTISLQGVTSSYSSTTNTARFVLASGQELDSAASVHVTISGVQDVAGNAMAAPVATTGAVSGDTTAPTIASAYVNWMADASGATLDIGFDEDVSTSGPGSILNWGASGSGSVSSVLRLSDKHYRVVFAAPLGTSEQVTLAGVVDPAGNAVGGSLSVDPLE